MSDKRPPAFDRSDRKRSLAVLDLLQDSAQKTIAAIHHAQPAQVHPQLGPLVLMPKQDAGATISQLYVCAEFARDMVEQLMALEKHTGVSALSLVLGRYAGVPVPKEAKELDFSGDELAMLLDVPSTIMPGQTIKARKTIAVAGKPTEIGEIFTAAQLRAAKEEFDAERKNPN